MPAEPESQVEPDWDKLREISERAQRESLKPGWSMARWRTLEAEAAAATNGHCQYTEFMAEYLPREVRHKKRRGT